MTTKKASVFEVGPRDGLQSESACLSLEDRKELIRMLVASGLKRIEVGSFVRSDRIPQLKDTDQLFKALRALPKAEIRDVEFWAFVPNEIGFQKAAESGVDGMSFFVAASDTFCQKNVNRSQEELVTELSKLLPMARKKKISTRIYLSTLVYCPFEGVTDPKKVERLVKALRDIGADEIALSDTTGHANPRSIRKVLERVLKAAPAKKFALHLHDTRGLALANVLEGINHDISTFDSSAGGMGGCPYAPGAAGNLATEDLVNMLAGMGLLADTDLGKVAQASMFAQEKLGKKLPSKVLRTLEKT